ncbi:hypothetical protein UYSO10_3877 [Kosakonia radicincitans]|nr:hypothetical protein UYSO10_3877 [Kosakonia radicincitans]
MTVKYINKADISLKFIFWGYDVKVVTFVLKEAFPFHP